MKAVRRSVWMALCQSGLIIYMGGKIAILFLKMGLCHILNRSSIQLMGAEDQLVLERQRLRLVGLSYEVVLLPKLNGLGPHLFNCIFFIILVCSAIEFPADHDFNCSIVTMNSEIVRSKNMAGHLRPICCQCAFHVELTLEIHAVAVTFMLQLK